MDKHEIPFYYDPHPEGNRKKEQKQPDNSIRVILAIFAEISLLFLYFVR